MTLPLDVLRAAHPYPYQGAFGVTTHDGEHRFLAPGFLFSVRELETSQGRADLRPLPVSAFRDRPDALLPRYDRNDLVTWTALCVELGQRLSLPIGGFSGVSWVKMAYAWSLKFVVNDWTDRRVMIVDPEVFAVSHEEPELALAKAMIWANRRDR